MRKNNYFAIVLLMTIVNTSFSQLPPAPQTLTECMEIAFDYNPALPELWNGLSAPERIFAYYLYRAMIPGNRIYAGQRHRDGQNIQYLFQMILDNTKKIVSHKSIDLDLEKFISQSELFLIYLYAHHGHYFIREFSNHKRTPALLGLELLTYENIKKIAALISPELEQIVETVKTSLFDQNYEPTITVPGSIEHSAGNMYSPDFTTSDFAQLTPEEQQALNSYCYIDARNGERIPRIARYAIGGMYGTELALAQEWLKKAQNISLEYPEYFDPHIPASLTHLIRYLESGDEEDFKKFSIEWIKTKSKIDFNFGFIEVYEDPQQYRGSFEADITIKAIDMTALNTLLPKLEAGLPFPPLFKRDNLLDPHNPAPLPNASINAKLFGAGGAGPVNSVAAYCLPNYAAIRAEHGSKQIMYHTGKSIAERKDFAKARALFNSTRNEQWLTAHDPQGELRTVLHDILVVLHETLGHGSGKLVPPVTDSTIGDLIGKYYSGLEELRAEIIALLSCLRNIDTLAEKNLFKGWENRISRTDLIDQIIISMAKAGLSRLISMHPDETEITQAHTQANATILNYLVDHESVAIVQEKKIIDGKEFTVLDIEVIDQEKAVRLIEELACTVQRIKSTGDSHGVAELLEQYGMRVRHPEYITLLKTNLKELVGDIKETVEIYPTLLPVYDAKNTIIDIRAQWPETFLEQQYHIRSLMDSSQ